MSLDRPAENVGQLSTVEVRLAEECLDPGIDRPPAELLIDFSTGFGNPAYYGFKSYYGKMDRFHINTLGQTRRMELAREALCEDTDHDCVPDSMD